MRLLESFPSHRSLLDPVSVKDYALFFPNGKEMLVRASFFSLIIGVGY